MQLTNRPMSACLLLLFSCSLAAAEPPQPVIVKTSESGRLSGQIQTHWITGKTGAPDVAVMAFFQEGKVFATTDTDTEGNFTLEFVPPGEYTAHVNIPEGNAQFPLHVVGAEADGNQILVTMTPTPDGCDCQVAVDDTTVWAPTEDFIAPTDPTSIDGPFEFQEFGYAPGLSGYGGSAAVAGGASAGFGGGMAGGFGGALTAGGGLFGPLAGAAGLAGLAAIDDDDDPNPVVSPATP